MSEILAAKRPKQDSCMICFSRTARYYGTWAEEGLCRPCVLGMEPEVRLKVQRDMNQESRKCWQADNLTSLGKSYP